MPNLVLKTIMTIKKVYGLEICVFMAHSRGATSGLSLSAVLPILASFVSRRTLIALHNNSKLNLH